MTLRRWLPAFLTLMPLSAQAHTGVVPPTGFAQGLLHPLTGLDHLLAALGVGLWATLQHPAARRHLPWIFLSALLVGLPLGFAWPTPVAPAGTLASVLLLGIALMLTLRPPAAFSLLLVVLLGLVHGHVHGTELSPGANLPYVTGLMASTALLTATGYATGRWLQQRQATAAFRYAGLVSIVSMAALLF